MCGGFGVVKAVRHNFLRASPVNKSLSLSPLEYWDRVHELFFLASVLDNRICSSAAVLFFQVCRGGATGLLVQIFVEYFIVILFENYEIHGLPKIVKIIILDILLHLVALQNHRILNFTSLVHWFELFRLHDIKWLNFDHVALLSLYNRHWLLAAQFFHVARLLFLLWWDHRWSGLLVRNGCRSGNVVILLHENDSISVKLTLLVATCCCCGSLHVVLCFRIWRRCYLGMMIVAFNGLATIVLLQWLLLWAIL